MWAGPAGPVSARRHSGLWWTVSTVPVSGWMMSMPASMVDGSATTERVAAARVPPEVSTRSLAVSTVCPGGRAPLALAPDAAVTLLCAWSSPTR